MLQEESNTINVSKTEFDCLMEMMTGLQNQVSSMKRELSDKREATNERLKKRIELDKAQPLRRATRSNSILMKKFRRSWQLHLHHSLLCHHLSRRPRGR